jgi:outer membrane protein OmpA-like peptidoglycan-associated protein
LNVVLAIICLHQIVATVTSVLAILEERRMKTPRLINCLGVVVLGLGLMGCSMSLSGGAGLSADGSTAILTGSEPIQVEAMQPALPPPPPPPPKPIVVLKAKVVGKKIEITEKVMFDYNKATIKVESNDLLGDVGKVLAGHAEIGKIRIEGHSDSDGSNRFNKKLSQKRADSVKQFLAGLGIDEGRLEAIGYGEDRPIASNDNDEGKEKNRRVEFNILKRSKEKSGGLMVAPIVTPVVEKEDTAEKSEDGKQEAGQ